MRRKNILTAVLTAACLLTAVQQVWAGQPFAAASNVIVAGQGGSAPGGSSSGASETFTTNAPGSTGTAGSAAGQAQAPGGPSGGAGGGAPASTAAPAAPSGGTAASSSPVITPGSASGTVSAGQGAPGTGGQDTPAAGQAAPAASSEGAAGSGSPVIVSGGGESSAAAPVSSESPSVPPGSEGTVLTPVGEAAGQTAQEGGQPQAPEAAQSAQASGGRTIDPSKPMVALTFDDGPQPSVGNRIMDCLAQYGGKATFFMVGERVGSHKAEVQRMVAEGHEVANHSMNHKYFQKLGAAEIRSQVEQCNDAIEAACGVRPKLMRLPGGNVNSTVKANVNMPMIQWNIDTLDWKTKNADKTVAAVLDHVKDGDIILMHELYSQSGDAALRIIPELHRRGYQMVTVSEMAAAKGYSLEAGKLYSSFR